MDITRHPVLTLRLPPEMVKKLREAKITTGVPINEQIKRLLLKAL